ncbi:hypothetical protein K8S19_12490 [bacterium]|nr:hypothetical protein [bacterium]
MKKFLLLACAVVLVAGMASSSFAATTQTFNITVTFNAVDIDLSVTGTPLATWGDVGASQNIFSNNAAGEIRHTITQNGYLKIDFNVSATCATGWTMLQTGIGVATADNECRLAGIFTEAVETGVPSRFLALTDFNDDDVISNVLVTPTVASTSTLGRNTGNLPAPDDSEALKGYSVPDAPGGFTTRSIRYMLQTPLTVSGTGVNEQTIVITIGAQLAA